FLGNPMSDVSSITEPAVLPDNCAIIPGLLWAYRFRADGSAQRLPEALPVSELASPDGWLWLHFSLSDMRGRAFIESCGQLPAAARLTLLKADEHLCLEATDGVVHGVFADLQRDLGGRTQEIGKLHFAFDDHLVVSTRRHALHAVDEARQKVDRGVPFHAAVGLMEEIVDQFAKAIADMLTGLSDELDIIEDRLLDESARDDRVRLAPVRRLAVRLHRQLLALRGLFHQLETRHHQVMPAGVVQSAARLAQRLDSLDHEAVVLQERARLMHEETNAKINSETNRHLHALSILTALLLPPTLVVGIFGMNTKNLPLTQDEWGSWIALGICVASSYGAYWILRKTGVLQRGIVFPKS
ncbi:MAG: CorA family divalent cation transporter, partial [Beijerinckiaceae bacterium]